MNIDVRPYFPKDNSIVNYDSNLFLLHTHYYRDIDTLFNIYIDKTTGKSHLEKREAPEVPVFIARKTPKYPQEYINRDSCERYMILKRIKLQENFCLKESISTLKMNGEMKCIRF